jgi:hypothetical protein
MAMSTEELMEYKQNLEETLLGLSSRTDETEALIASCRALAQSDVVTRSAEFRSVLCALKDFPQIGQVINCLEAAIEYHPDPDGFEEELRSMRKTLDDAKTEWKQSSVVKEENGHLEFEDLEGEDNEVSVKREKSLTALQYLIDMEISLLGIQFCKRLFINGMTDVVDPLIISTYDIACTCNSTASPGDLELLDQNIGSLNLCLSSACARMGCCNSNKDGFNIAADGFKASML